MSMPVVEKIGAFIIRPHPDGSWLLLLFRHADIPEVPAQIPGGTVEAGTETIEEALHREIVEESGLYGLRIIRKLGLSEWFWPERRVTVKRHLFLLEAPINTPDEWIHLVGGNGEDARLRFGYHWQKPDAAFKLGGGLDGFLTNDHLPELYPLPIDFPPSH